MVVESLIGMVGLALAWSGGSAFCKVGFCFAKEKEERGKKRTT